MPVRWRRRQRGFSLIELGIVLSVIAILAAIVIGSAGYFRAARERTAVDLVLTIRKASQQYSMRHLKGVAYGVSTAQGIPQNTTLTGLQAENFLPTNVTTPWGSTNIVVAPHTAGTNCTGYSCIKIDMEVPDEECVGNPPYFVTALQALSVSVACNGTMLSVVMR